MFTRARFHDNWAIYRGDRWENCEAEGYEISPSILPALHRNRERVLQVATLIVPGHGAPFMPDESTPR